MKSNPPTRQFFAIPALWVLALFLFIPFAWLAFYNHPSADDYPLSQTARDWGQYTTVVGYWKCWSARYTSIFFMSINPLVFGSLWKYKAGFAGIFFMQVLAFRFLLPVLFRLDNENYTWLLAAVASLVFLSSSPSLSNGYYYLGGALFYQPGHLLLTLLVFLIFRNSPPINWPGKAWKSWMMIGAQCALVIGLAGCNEVMMLVGLAFAGLGFGWFLMFNKRFHVGWFLLLITVIASAALVIFSPASFYRMEASGTMNRSLSWVAGEALKALFHTVFQAFTSPPWLALLGVFWFLQPMPLFSNLTRLQKIWLSIFSGFTFYLVYFPSMLGEGLVQGRTEVTFQFLLFAVLLLLFNIWRPNRNVLHFSTIATMLLVVLALVPFGKNYLPAVNDLVSGDAKQYNMERNARIACLETALSDSVWVKPVSVKPKSLFVGDIGDYPQPWYDNHVAIYHGKKFIHLVDAKHPEPTCE